MPQGKGTYGSQVGRPSKKKYDKGGSVDPFSTRNPTGVPAEQLAEVMENQNMANQGLPTTNAQDRSQVSPDVTEYKEGGEVRDTSKKGLEKHWKESVERTKEGALKGRINYKPKGRPGGDPPDKPYNITDVVKTVGHKENIKKGYKEYWDKENKAIKKKKGKKK